MKKFTYKIVDDMNYSLDWLIGDEPITMFTKSFSNISVFFGECQYDVYQLEAIYFNDSKMIADSFDCELLENKSNKKPFGFKYDEQFYYYKTKENRKNGLKRILDIENLEIFRINDFGDIYFLLVDKKEWLKYADNSFNYENLKYFEDILRNNVYTIEIYENKELVDSLSGCVGYSYAKEEAKELVKNAKDIYQTKILNKLKELIKCKVPINYRKDILKEITLRYDIIF